MQYKFAPGQVFRYQIDVDETLVSKSNKTVARTTPIQTKLTGVRNEQVKQVFPNGDAEILYTFESMRINDGKNWQNTQLPAVTLLVSNTGVVKDTRGLESKGGFFAAMPFLNPENLDEYMSALPGSTVSNVGDSWTQDILIPGLAKLQSVGGLKANGKLLSLDETANGVKTVKYNQTVGGTVRFVMAAPLSGQPDGSMDTAMIVNAQADNYFSPEKGAMMLNEGQGSTRLNSEVKDSKGNSMGIVNTLISIKYQVSLLSIKRP